MTLIFGVDTQVARDFALMIQSVGMTSASLVIYWMRIPIEWRAVLFAGLGGALGVVLGIELIAPALTPAYTKLFFVSFWLSFGVALYWVNRNRDREVLTQIEDFGTRQAATLLTVGIIGGMVSGVTGSGLDIVTFSFLVLAYNLCEKVGTPTSVVLMASNAVIGFLWRGGVAGSRPRIPWGPSERPRQRAIPEFGEGHRSMGEIPHQAALPRCLGVRPALTRSQKNLSLTDSC